MLRDVGLDETIVDEVEHRTPGYVSWQGDQWLDHCGDACEFHGDATTDDVAHASEATRAHWYATSGMPDGSWERVMADYRPGLDLAVYKFVCRHCGMVLFHWDMS